MLVISEISVILCTSQSYVLGVVGLACALEVRVV
uniref:Uncharacterized protein n=1 Tax=Arundo donax TaxID=35708 RepID=A0A0A9BBU9_ARUDO